MTDEHAKLLKAIEEDGGSSSVRQILRRFRKYGTAENTRAALNDFIDSTDQAYWDVRIVRGQRIPVVCLRYPEQKIPTTVGETVTSVERSNDVCLTYHGEKWLSVEEILALSQIDLALWQVDRVEQRGYEVTGKMHQGQAVTSTGQLQWLPETLWKSKNRYIAIRLVRRAPQPIQDAIAQLVKRVTWPKLTPSKPRLNGKSVMELSLYDIHLGKYCWGSLTGQSYDNQIANAVFRNAVVDLLERTKSFDVDRIVLPIGHDFFQVDNWVGQTVAGTPVDSCDDRFSRTFEIGIDAVRFCIDQCRQVGAVEVIYVPGNHDRSTSFYLCKVLEAAYEDERDVSIDVATTQGHRGRKYRLFGRTLLGYIHGGQKDQPREQNLPLLMAQECPKWWAASVDRAWRLGHLHTKRTSVVPVGDIFNGVRIERLPSLSATDAWHWDNGFVGNRRSAEAWIWDYTDGYLGQFTAYAREE